MKEREREKKEKKEGGGGEWADSERSIFHRSSVFVCCCFSSQKGRMTISRVLQREFDRTESTGTKVH